MDEQRTRRHGAEFKTENGEEPVRKRDRDLSPSEIEEKSFRILEGLLGDFQAPAPEREVMKRVAHATTDVEWAKTFRFSPNAVQAGIEAAWRGAPVVTDVEMVSAGVRRSAAEARRFRNAQDGNETLCFLNDPDVAEEAKRNGTTARAWRYGRLFRISTARSWPSATRRQPSSRSAI